MHSDVCVREKIVNQMLTCLNCPFAAEFLQRWLLIMFLVFTHVCVGGVRVPLSLVCKHIVVLLPVHICPTAHGSLELTFNVFLDHPLLNLKLVDSCQSGLPVCPGRSQSPTLSTGLPGRRYMAQLPCIYVGTGDTNSDLHTHKASALPPSRLSGPHLLPLIVKDESKTRTLVWGMHWIMCFDSAYGRL